MTLKEVDILMLGYKYFSAYSCICYLVRTKLLWMNIKQMGLIYIRCQLESWYHLGMQGRRNASLVWHSADNTKHGASKRTVYEAVILKEARFSGESCFQTQQGV